jgi:hypothetical protein
VRKKLKRKEIEVLIKISTKVGRQDRLGLEEK